MPKRQPEQYLTSEKILLTKVRERDLTVVITGTERTREPANAIDSDATKKSYEKSSIEYNNKNRK